MQARKPYPLISESSAIRDMLPLITFDTWVLLDLDNTVIEPLLELGSDQWFVKMIDYAVRLNPNDKSEKIALVIAIYHAVQHHVRSRAVEPTIVFIIQALQAIGIPVLGVTARDQCLIEPTTRQLAEVGVDFAVVPKDKGDRHELTVRNKKAVYDNRIIYCGGIDKGSCLKAFFAAYLHPKRIVMVDDKMHHLLNVKEAVESLGIKFNGLRYGFLDEKVRAFEIDKAHQQLAQLKSELSANIQTLIEELKVIPSHTASTDANFLQFFYKKEAEKASAVSHSTNANLLLKRKALPTQKPEDESVKRVKVHLEDESVKRKFANS